MPKLPDKQAQNNPPYEICPVCNKPVSLDRACLLKASRAFHLRCVPSGPEALSLEAAALTKIGLIKALAEADSGLPAAEALGVIRRICQDS